MTKKLESEEGLLEKVSLLLIITVVFLQTPLTYPDHDTCVRRSTSVNVIAYLLTENTGYQLQVPELY